MESRVPGAVKTIGLVAKPRTAEGVSLARQLKERLPDTTFLVEEHHGQALGWAHVSGEELGHRSDLVIVLGGDGTLIHAARLLKGRAVPILGVNLGSLGFLTEVPVPELFPMLDKVLAGQAVIEPRMKLLCRVYRDGKLLVDDEVLNDVVIAKGALATIQELELVSDGTFVTRLRADGLILSTPTGSTAYTLSAGGPIVSPALDAVIVTPICPHALTQRPFVVPPDQQLEVRLPGEVNEVFVTIDGKTGLPMKRGDRVEVRKSPHRAHLVRNPERDYFSVLRQKLHWGER